jgi:hypothetical protein
VNSVLSLKLIKYFKIKNYVIHTFNIYPMRQKVDEKYCIHVEVKVIFSVLKSERKKIFLMLLWLHNKTIGDLFIRPVSSLCVFFD